MYVLPNVQSHIVDTTQYSGRTNPGKTGVKTHHGFTWMTRFTGCRVAAGKRLGGRYDFQRVNRTPRGVRHLPRAYSGKRMLDQSPTWAIQNNKRFSPWVFSYVAVPVGAGVTAPNYTV